MTFEELLLDKFADIARTELRDSCPADYRSAMRTRINYLMDEAAEKLVVLVMENQ